ncbi:MoaD/ThiS family protein [Phaeovibrio sulfidiphilus]|uniref:MoaD/ThiS family protein n=1 Tax=Phaeovibrio sulfidiphilus TaxID=1220600 RepID=A0A8J6YZJ5_9PROT|nr:MoaD/ThiS family protein [Phaeovibrio sulfidiphilus]MBE1237388.1 MoaD/ThiS family protein [Phaeovibrio sulfidiphilus]
MLVRVHLYGPFRSTVAERSFDLPDGARVSDLRAAFARVEMNHPLLARSRFATEEGVLQENERLASGMILAVIAPVSGG